MIGIVGRYAEPVYPELDELAIAAGRQAEISLTVASHSFDREIAARFRLEAEDYKRQQVGLLAGFYVVYELRKGGARADLMKQWLRKLEAETCYPECRELTELVNALAEVVE